MSLQEHAMLENACQRVLRAVLVFFLVSGFTASVLMVSGLQGIDFLLVIPFRTMNPWLAALLMFLNVIAGILFGC
ncbi:MAG: hypothetical protein LM590_07870 [Thermofilum sp.]|nr:hypothetical protein [Thermofilum sp.]